MDRVTIIRTLKSLVVILAPPQIRRATIMSLDVEAGAAWRGLCKPAQ